MCLVGGGLIPLDQSPIVQGDSRSKPRQCTLEYNALLWPHWSSLSFIWSLMAWFGLLWHHLTPFGPVLPHLTWFGPLRPDSSVPRGGKRGGAREHCSQKEMDRTILGNTCIMQHLHHATRTSCNTCIMQHMNYARCELCNICIIQHMHFVTHT